ncbi:MAG: putative bifunctional diguanylate cyclase/phosphodiesterase [Acidiferrobacteraceae bacterium]
MRHIAPPAAPEEDDLRYARLALRALIALLLAAMSVFGYYAWHRAQELATRRLGHLADFAAQSSDLFLGRLVNNLSGLSRTFQSAGTRYMDPTSARIGLEEFLSNNPGIAAVAMIAPDGHFIASAEDWRGGGLLKGNRADALRKLNTLCRSDNPLCLAAPWVIHSGHNALLPLVYKSSRNGVKHIGVIALLRLGHTREIWGQPSLPNKAAMGLIENNRYLILREPKTRHLDLQPFGALVKALRRHPHSANGTYQGYVPVAHTDRLGVYRRLAHYPLAVFISIPGGNILRYWGSYVTVPTILALVLIIGFYLIYYWGLEQRRKWWHESRRAERRLSDVRERALITLQSIRDAVITTDMDGRVDYLNPAAMELTGCGEEAVGQPLGSVYRPTDVYKGTQLPDPVEVCLRGGHIKNGDQEGLLVSRTGTHFPIEHSAAPLRNLEGVITGIVAVFRDITEKKVLSNRFAHQATHDLLTDLPNRTLFFEHVQRIMASDREAFALLFIEADGLEAINNNYGHYVGDRALVATPHRLRGRLPGNGLLFQYSENKFAVVVPHTGDTGNATHLAQQFLDALKAPLSTSPDEVFVKPSVGLAFHPGTAANLDLLYRATDTALGQAKRSGGGTYRVFDAAATDGHTRPRVGIDAALRHALERDELVLVYQPQIDLMSGRIVAAEALIRWNHPRLGAVSPTQFIPIAEDNGLIIPIGEWVLRTACRQNRAWRDRQLPSVTVGVNVSGRQCYDEAILKLVSDVLSETKLPADALQLELTESLLIHGDQRTLRILAAWQELGVSLAIDDFGTGYSSLSYLKHLPVDTLKIDHSFMGGVPENESDNALLKAIIAIGRSLNMQTVAEGVETEAQWEFLRSFGCDLGQGFVIARPMPASRFEELLKQDPRLRVQRKPPHLRA